MRLGIWRRWTDWFCAGADCSPAPPTEHIRHTRSALHRRATSGRIAAPRYVPRLASPGATYGDLIDAAHARGIKIIQDVVINHSCQYGIRGKVHIDHLPIKYYVPQGSEPGRVDHGPYQGSLGNYAWENGCNPK